MEFVNLPQEFETPVLSREAIDKFTMTALPACLNLIDTLPDTVYQVCDLLITITKHNGEVWRDEMLDTLVADVSCFLVKVGCMFLSYIVHYHIKNSGCDFHLCTVLLHDWWC
jgi:hypothetical protein